MFCNHCGEPATIKRHTGALCQFHWDCLFHELQIILDAIRDFGKYSGKATGPRYLGIYYNGKNTIGCGMYLPRNDGEAMREANLTAEHNGWQLLRVDYQRTLRDVFVSPYHAKYFPGCTKQALAAAA